MPIRPEETGVRWEVQLGAVTREYMTWKATMMYLGYELRALNEGEVCKIFRKYNGKSTFVAEIDLSGLDT